MTDLFPRGVIAKEKCRHCGIRLAWHDDGLCDLCWKYEHQRTRKMQDPINIPRRYPDYIPAEEEKGVTQAEKRRMQQAYKRRYQKEYRARKKAQHDV